MQQQAILVSVIVLLLLLALALSGCDGGGGGREEEGDDTLTVTEVNRPPVLAPVGNQSGPEGTVLTLIASATDPDPGETFRFSLDAGAPAGASIDPATGQFSWTPTAAGTFPVTVRVTDAGGLSDAETITITVAPVTVNRPPVLNAIGNQSGPEGSALTFTATATDPDAGDILRFSLDAGVPAGTIIDPTTGVFQWTPTEAQGPGTFSVTVRVTDVGGLSDAETLTFTVTEVNRPPVLNTIGKQSGPERTELTFTANATDADLPANPLTFRLDAGAPAGATIDPTTGQFSWTPTGAQSPWAFTVTVRVTDNGTPALSASETITITVTERSFLVNSTTNQHDAAPGDGRCETTPGNGQCTLRAAIEEANALPGDDVIDVPPGLYRLATVDNTTDGENGLPSVTSVITIQGDGADTTTIEREANAPPFRIFHVAVTGNLALDGLTIMGGSVVDTTVIGGGLFNAGTLALTNSTVRNNSISMEDFSLLPVKGGGIFSSGTLTLTNSLVGDNIAGSDIFGDGGGLFSTGVLILINSLVSNNVAGVGGGIYTDGIATLTNSTVSMNAAIRLGVGGIENGGTLTLINSSISDNFGLDFAGGIGNFGTLTLMNSTVSNNVAAGVGGGIDNFGGILTLINSTVSGNVASLSGGGISGGGTLTLMNSTVSDNAAGIEGSGGISGDGTLTHTIVAGNRTESGAECSGTLTSLGHNMTGKGTGCPNDGPGDQTVDPADVFTTVLGPLQNNGGPTETHALLPGSPAIDAGGLDCPPPDTDQRGELRPRDGDGNGTTVCDIGAFEL